MTKRQSFFIRYMANIWTPTKMINTKSDFSMCQLLVLCLFLISVLLTPFVLFHHQVQQLTDYIPHLESMATEKVMKNIQTLEFKDGKKTGPVFTVMTKVGKVESVNQSVNREQLKGNRLIFGPDAIYLSDDSHRTMVISYPMKRHHFAGNSSEFIKEMNQLWQQQNQLSLKLSFLSSTFSIITTIFILVALVATLGLYFVLKKVKSSAPVKEAITLTILCAGLPVIIAMLCAFVTRDAMVGLQLQLSLWVLMIVFVFCKVLYPALNIGRELKELIWRGEK